MKKILIILLFALVCSGCKKNITTQSPAPTPVEHYDSKLQVADKILNVEIADNDASRQQGLSGRYTMAEDNGMLFKFNEKNKTAFWMKDMKFDLDFIWIADGKIIGLTKNVPAPIGNYSYQKGNLPLYYPPSDVDEVLEVNSGWNDSNKIKIGDEVREVK